MNLALSLLAACERHPEREAFPGLTYGELLPRIRRVAGAPLLGVPVGWGGRGAALVAPLG